MGKCGYCGADLTVDVVTINKKDIGAILLYKFNPLPDRFTYLGIDIRWTGWKPSQEDTSLKGQWFSLAGGSERRNIIEVSVSSDMANTYEENESLKRAGLDMFLKKAYESNLICQ